MKKRIAMISLIAMLTSGVAIFVTLIARRS